MAIRWEVSKVRTKTEELMAEIMLLPQPVGIVLLGDDCEFKNEIVGRFSKICGVRVSWDMYPVATIGNIISAFEQQENYLIMLNAPESRSYDTRKQCVYTLRDCGAKSIVGVYIAPTKKVKFSDIPKTEEFDLMMVPKREEG